MFIFIFKNFVQYGIIPCPEVLIGPPHFCTHLTSCSCVIFKQTKSQQEEKEAQTSKKKKQKQKQWSLICVCVGHTLNS